LLSSGRKKEFEADETTTGMLMPEEGQKTLAETPSQQRREV